MSVDNGRRVRLIVDGLFDGMAGEADGVVAFMPNRFSMRPEAARGGLMDDQPVLLVLDARRSDGRIFSYRWRRP